MDTPPPDKAEEMPTFFLSHGGGPCFFLESNTPPMSEMDKNSDVDRWYKTFAANFVTTKPSAILVISAHWEEAVVHVQSKAKPSLYFDYYGFPPHTYELTYPSPGNPQLAKKVVDLLTSANIKAQLDDKRDYDHGIFVPLKVMYPNADIPVVGMSLVSGLDPDLHFRIGQALQPLRKEGVLIVGSGFATHNTVASFSDNNWAAPWVDWLSKVVTKSSDPSELRRNLVQWSAAPQARKAHPREEHLIPLHVAAGAGGGKNAEIILDKFVGTLSFLSFKWK